MTAVHLTSFEDEVTGAGLKWQRRVGVEGLASVLDLSMHEPMHLILVTDNHSPESGPIPLMF